MIAIHNQPFLIVEDYSFIELLAELGPKYVIPSSNYFNETMFQKANNSLRLKTTKEFSHIRLRHSQEIC